MSHKLNIEDLKKEYIGKTFNWLTVIDVIRNNKNRVCFVCKCKCGTVIEKQCNKVLSGHSISCGCYAHSKEKADNYSKYCKEHPEMIEAIQEKRKKKFLEDPDILKHSAEKHSQWYKDNPDLAREVVEKHADALVKKRKEIDFSELVPIIHSDYVDDLLLGKLNSTSIIKTKCPRCGEYDTHSLHNVFSFSRQKLQSDKPRLCARCSSYITASSYEEYVSDFISSFYNGTLIRNSKSIIPPLELDLYYPEKHIAVEFNGDYWHSDKFKENDYHYNKYISCLNKNILLISIFEHEWKLKQDIIKEYIINLFSGIEHSLSFNSDKTLLNNNYPCVNAWLYHYDTYIEDFYNIKNSAKRVYTCGFSKINDMGTKI